MENELMATARAAAAAGARVLRGLWGGRLAVEAKASFDFVTNADRASQAAVLGVIRARHPDHVILAEEDAGAYPPPGANEGVLWVVDPLDGTTNFIHGIPHVAVSVGALVDGRPTVGVIVDVTRGEEFWGLAGGGAWLGERPIRVSGQGDPSQSLLLTGFPFRDKGRLDDYLALFAELFRQVSGVRRAGAAALDLAYVAAGRAEGFWEMGLKPWDLAAGLVLVAEAGGVVSDFAGGDLALWRGDVVAAAPTIHGLIQAACARRFPTG
ncbi:MAG: inositol monophosphatase [Desulfarculus sp.]|nr:inositol monophosphatase [Desulfarculus sp.]